MLLLRVMLRLLQGRPEMAERKIQDMHRIPMHPVSTLAFQAWAIKEWRNKWLEDALQPDCGFLPMEHPLFPCQAIGRQDRIQEDALTSPGRLAKWAKGCWQVRTPAPLGLHHVRCLPLTNVFHSDSAKSDYHVVTLCPKKEQYDCIQTCQAGRGIKECDRFPGLQATAANPGLGMTENLLTSQWKCAKKKNTKTKDSRWRYS